MQLSMRADRVRASLEAAAQTPAHVTDAGPGRVRIAVPIHPDLGDGDFQDVLAAARLGDDWGSSGETGTVTVWAEVAGSTR